jgi:hypothetical protein
LISVEIRYRFRPNALLLAAVILTNLAERLAVPYPSLLAIVGAGLAFLPFAPQIRIEPELALALFVDALSAEEKEVSLRAARYGGFDGKLKTAPGRQAVNWDIPERLAA